MIDKNIFAAVAACVVALSSPFADGEELYAFEFLHLEKAVGRYNDDPSIPVPVLVTVRVLALIVGMRYYAV